MKNRNCQVSLKYCLSGGTNSLYDISCAKIPTWSRGCCTELNPPRHVMLPKEQARMVPKSRLLAEDEWRNLGVQQSRGWEHYAIHRCVYVFVFPSVIMDARSRPSQKWSTLAFDPRGWVGKLWGRPSSVCVFVATCSVGNAFGDREPTFGRGERKGSREKRSEREREREMLHIAGLLYSEDTVQPRCPGHRFYFFRHTHVSEHA